MHAKTLGGAKYKHVHLLLLLKTRDSLKYNSFVNPFISCKTDTIISYTYVHYNAGYKEVTQKPATTDLQFCMEIFVPIIIGICSLTFSVLMHIGPTIEVKTSTTFIVQELMNYVQF